MYIAIVLTLSQRKLIQNGLDNPRVQEVKKNTECML